MPDADHPEIIDAEEVSMDDLEAKKREAMQKLNSFKDILEKVRSQAANIPTAGPDTLGGITPIGTIGPEGLLAMLEREGIRYKTTRTVPGNPDYDCVTILLKDIEAYDNTLRRVFAARASRLVPETPTTEPPEAVTETVAPQSTKATPATAPKGRAR